MTRSFSGIGLLGLLRRLIVAALVCAAAVLAGRAGLWPALAVLLLAVLIYAVTRRKTQAALRYAAGPAVIGPDWLGLVWGAVFLALPLWTADAAPGLPPSVWLLWPMAGAGLIFLWIGWRADTFGLDPGAEGLDLRRGLGRLHLPYAEIRAHRPWRRDLPRWMRALAPLLASGRPTAAGAVMLARPRRGMMLELHDGEQVVIETDALLPGPEPLLLALTRAGVGGPPRSAARTSTPKAKETPR